MKIGNESSVERGGGILKKILAASALTAALTIPVLIAPASAADSVRNGRTIEAFIGSDLVNVQNYPANKQVTIEVVRNGVVAGSVSGKTDASGFAEFNHTGGGQVAAGGDCFKPPVSPDIMPGDTIRTKTQGDRGARDSAVVRDVEIDFDSITTGANTIEISGRVNPNATNAAGVTPRTDVLELRLNKGSADLWDTGPGLDQDRPGRKDLRVDIGENVQADGSWKRTLNVSSQDAQDWANNPGEVGLEWSVGAGAGAEEAAPPAIFVADEAGGEAILGCPPLRGNALTHSSSSVLNKASVGKGLRLGGISKGATAVSVTLDDRNASTSPVELTATPRAAYMDGFQAWKTPKMNAGQLRLLKLLKDGRLTARATYSVAGTEVSGNSLMIRKDTVAPRAPRATPKPGVYNRVQRVTLSAQPRAEIHYTLNGKRPTAASRTYNRQIRIGKTRTVKATAIDQAGNKSAVGSFRYVIRR